MLLCGGVSFMHVCACVSGGGVLSSRVCVCVCPLYLPGGSSCGCVLMCVHVYLAVSGLFVSAHCLSLSWLLETICL